MKIVVEIGANEGQDTVKFLDDSENILYCFEPVPKLAYDLFEKFGHNERFHLVPLAVDIKNTFSNFNISVEADWGCSSLHDFTDNIRDLWNRPEFDHSRHFQAMCIRLDTFMNLYNLSKIDYLHIDAQGNDFRVLKSLGDRIHNVVCGVCEAANTVNLYKENNHVDSIKPWLESKGFQVRIEDDGVGKPDATITGNEVNLFFNR